MSGPINNGGPAFPLVAEGHEHVLSIGLTLRDYFAAQALIGFIASDRNFLKDDGARVKTTEDYAFVAYEAADAMLKARSK